MNTLTQQLGMNIQDNFQDEERTYSLGKNNYIPISLLLSLMSSYKDSAYRIFNIFVSSYAISQANLDLTKIIDKDKLQQIKDQFDEGYEYESPFDVNANKSLEPDYKHMEIYDYIDMWNVFLNMATPKYNTGSEYSVLECTRDFVRFRARKEFLDPRKAVETALLHILSEVSTIMKQRGFVVSDDGYHIYLEGYTPLQIKDYYGF